MSEIVLKDKNIIVVFKEPGQSSQPDKTGGKSALEMYSELLEKDGESGELYLIHRLDKVVGGLLVFARNKSCAAELSKGIDADEFSKDYIAVCDGEPPEGEYKDYLIKNNILGKSEIVPSQRTGAKLASLLLTPLKTVSCENGKKTLVKIKLETGRFHQIRAQLSSRGCPIVGDKKYGNKDYGARFPALFAYKLLVICKQKSAKCVKMPDINSYPWKLFDKTIYEDLIK